MLSRTNITKMFLQLLAVYAVMVEADGCNDRDDCCTGNIFERLLTDSLAPYVDKILNGSSAFVLTNGDKTYSLASGGADFKIPILVRNAFLPSDNNVTLELASVKQPKDYVAANCRLVCRPQSNRIECQLPSITRLFPEMASSDTNEKLLAMPFAVDDTCINQNATLSLCYRLKINQQRVIFVPTELRRPQFLSTLRTSVAAPTYVMIREQIKLLPDVDPMLIYLPDPELHQAAKIRDDVIAITGKRLINDARTDTTTKVTISVGRLASTVECSTFEKEELSDVDDSNLSIAENESLILCDFERAKYASLLEDSRSEAVNGTELLMNVTLSIGYWRRSSFYIEKIAPRPLIESSTIMAIIIPVGIVVILLLVVTSCFCILANSKQPETIKRAAKIRQRFPVTGICLGFPQPEKVAVSSPEAPPKFSPEMFATNIATVIEQKRIHKGSIEVHGDIGNGHFGVVKRGIFRVPGMARRSEKPVAIKFIQNCTSQQEMREFFEEAVHMFSFDHRNVMIAYGVMYGEDEPPALVLPLMAVGDLRKFVQSAASKINDLIIVDFAQQIADGMAYLANQTFIHRDLAARNCLLNEFRVVKIADFGLSRLATGKDYEYVPTYSVQMQQRPLPIRWMAPECLEHGTFSEKTDVWAYGVVLWELASRGVRPYYALQTPPEVIRHVCVARELLPKLPCMSETMYDLMKRCWNEQPSERPRFSELVYLTRCLLNEPTSPLLQNISPDKLAFQFPGSGANTAEMEVYSSFKEALAYAFVKDNLTANAADPDGQVHAAIPATSREMSASSSGLGSSRELKNS